MKDTFKDYSHIKGWGIDADPKNDPTYPMKHRNEAGHEGYGDWKRPTQQPIGVEVLHSTERPSVSAVFGTSMPPKGLSGLIRRFAFKFGEGSYAHWLPLLVADRVNVVEGVIEDVGKGHIPNIWSEKGMRAEWRYNRNVLLAKIAAGVILTAATVLACSNKKVLRKA